MARRGTKKAHADAHEKYIATLYGGEQVNGSGQPDRVGGDVKTNWELFECKLTGQPGKPATSSLITRMEKIADEAWEEGREPALCLRFFKPDSVLANKDGYVDLTVRLSTQDAHGYQTNKL